MAVVCSYCSWPQLSRGRAARGIGEPPDLRACTLTSRKGPIRVAAHGLSVLRATIMDVMSQSVYEPRPRAVALPRHRGPFPGGRRLRCGAAPRRQATHGAGRVPRDACSAASASCCTPRCGRCCRCGTRRSTRQRRGWPRRVAGASDPAGRSGAGTSAWPRRSARSRSAASCCCRTPACGSARSLLAAARRSGRHRAAVVAGRRERAAGVAQHVRRAGGPGCARDRRDPAAARRHRHRALPGRRRRGGSASPTCSMPCCWRARRAVSCSAPGLLRLNRDLRRERTERIRSQERADVAAHLHDSVLQTLGADPAAGRRPADGRPAGADPGARAAHLAVRERRRRSRPLKAALAARRSAEVEDAHRVPIELVVVGDVPDRRRLTAAGRGRARGDGERGQALRRAADRRVCRGRAERELEVFVRDRGRGFDLDAVPERPARRTRLDHRPDEPPRRQRRGTQRTGRRAPRSAHVDAARASSDRPTSTSHDRAGQAPTMSAIRRSDLAAGRAWSTTTRCSVPA